MIKNIILDTDIGDDCDDAYALAMANIYHNEKKVNLLAVTHATSIKNGAYCAYAVNAEYGNKNIPIGSYSGKIVSDEKIDHYATAVKEKFVGNTAITTTDAVKLMREKLSCIQDKSVDLVAIGPLGNLYALLESGADGISSLSGQELILKKVKRVVIMGGAFGEKAKEKHHVEWNVKCDTVAFKGFLDGCNADVYLIDFFNGLKVETGETLNGKDDVVAYSFKSFGVSKRPSWDPLSVYFEVTEDEEVFSVKQGKVTVDDEGFTTFTGGDGNRYLVEVVNPDLATLRLEKLIEKN